jgi:O-antigen/teichoic acid export membrane protein
VGSLPSGQVIDRDSGKRVCVMNPLRKLATQTAIYGISSILGRFINYLLVPLYTYTFTPGEYGVVSEFYAYAGFLAVLLTFGMETGYFRFRESGQQADAVVYATALRFLLLANLGFFVLILVLDTWLAAAIQHPAHPEYLWWFALILALDSIGAIGFARLRAQNRAWRFAGIKLTEILIAVALNVLFIVYLPKLYVTSPTAWLATLWNPDIGVGYVFIANLAASIVKLILLSPQMRGALRGFDPALFRRLLRYSLPMVAIGLAGVVNEMLDRAAMKYLLPYDPQTNLAQLGIYSACYKLAILMSLFIQAFRYAAEPFFFAQAKQRNAPATYAAVLNYFVIFCVFIFLLVTLYLDLFQYFIGEAFREGLVVVPILLLANLFLGVYVNLSVWYKLTDRTLMGAYVAIAGAALTVGLLFWWVPLMGYVGAAWATLVCYVTMTCVSYWLGQRYYPAPYDLPRAVGYIALGLTLYSSQRILDAAPALPTWLSGTALLAIFLAIVYYFELRKLRDPRSQRHGRQ